MLGGKFIAIQAYFKKQEKKMDKQHNFTPNATIKKKKTHKRRKESWRSTQKINEKHTQN